MTENDLYLKPEKGSPFGRSLPVQAIIGSTPPPPGLLHDQSLVQTGSHKLPIAVHCLSWKNDLHSENNHSNNLFEILKLIKKTIRTKLIIQLIRTLLQFAFKTCYILC